MAAGVFERFWLYGLRCYDALEGIDWSWLSLDRAADQGSPGRGKKLSLNPTDRARRGVLDVGGFQIAGPAVENARRTVAAGGGDLRAVAMEGDGDDQIGMLLDEQLLFAGRDIVNADGIVGTGGSDPLAVGRDVISTLRDSSIIIRRNCGEVRSGFFWRYLPWPIPPRSNLNKSRANACNRPKATSCSLCNFSWSVN